MTLGVVDAAYVNAIEVCLAVAAVGTAFVFGKRRRRALRGFDQFRDRLKPVPTMWRGVFVALLPIAIRLALLPWMPVPSPAVQEEFSNLLEADTFAHGRLANPPHPMSVFFDNVQEIQYPKYVSARLPGTAVFLWAGEVLFHEPWVGICLVVGAMCAAVYWMLLGWTRPRWALFCAILFALHFGIFTYWMNSYWPASPAALGGALALGATARLIRRAAFWPAVLFAIGAVILAFNRPVEGVVIIAPAATAIAFSWFRAGSQLRWRDIGLKAVVPASAIGGACIGWMLYYNLATTGHPTLLAYSIWRKGQATAPTFWWQPLRMEHLVYYSRETWRFFHHFEQGIYTQLNQNWHARLRTLIWRVMAFPRAELGFLLTVPLLFSVARGRRGIVTYFAVMGIAAAGFAFYQSFNTLPIFLLLALYALALLYKSLPRAGVYATPIVILLLGLALRLLTVFSMPNYYPEFVAPAMILVAEGFRRMYVWQRERRTGAAMARNLFLATCAITVLRGAIPVLGIHLEGEDPFYMNSYENRLTDRIRVEKLLESEPGQQLAIVRYAPDHDELLEWVWNGADIDGQKIVWAREQDPAWMAQLLHYYQDRKPWLVEPDAKPARLTPYPPLAGVDMDDPLCAVNCGRPPRADYKDDPPGRECVFRTGGMDNCK